MFYITLVPLSEKLILRICTIFLTSRELSKPGWSLTLIWGGRILGIENSIQLDSQYEGSYWLAYTFNKPIIYLHTQQCIMVMYNYGSVYGSVYDSVYGYIPILSPSLLFQIFVWVQGYYFATMNSQDPNGLVDNRKRNSRRKQCDNVIYTICVGIGKSMF